MFNLQICFRGRWTTIYGPFPTQEDAHWSLAKWRQAADCRKDESFRVVPAERTTPPELIRCDVCQGEYPPERIGQSAADTVLCKVCLEQAREAMHLARKLGLGNITG